MLSGPVGAGKTTVAKELVKITKGQVVYIEGDTFWSYIAKGGEQLGMRGNFQVIMRSMLVAAMPYAAADYEVILDFSFPPSFLPTTLKLTGMRDVPVDFVVIRPDLEICAGRAADRMEGKIGDYTNYKNLYKEFDTVKRNIIYDNEGDAASIAAKVREGLDELMFRVSS